MHPDDVANSDRPYKAKKKIQSEKIQRKELSDDSRASTKNRSKSPECGRLPSPIPKDGKRNGLKPVAAIAVMIASPEAINSMKAEATGILGRPLTLSETASVLKALGNDALVPGIHRTLSRACIPDTDRAATKPSRSGNGSPLWRRATREAEQRRQKPHGAAGDDQCRHGKPDGSCAQCPERAGFDAAMEAF